MSLSFTWATRREGNDGIVEEYLGDRLLHQWRVPANVVPDLVEARRKLIALRMEQVKGRYSHTEQYIDPEDDSD